jgi:hypothetical protein
MRPSAQAPEIGVFATPLGASQGLAKQLYKGGLSLPEVQVIMVTDGVYFQIGEHWGLH